MSHPAIEKELTRQQEEHGYTKEHDSQHSLGDFMVFAETYLNRAKTKLSAHGEPWYVNEEAHKEFIKVGALVEAYLRI